MTTNNISIQDLVQREVIYCVSSLVYTLTQENKLEAEQAIDLWTAIDWDEAQSEIEQQGCSLHEDSNGYWRIYSEKESDFIVVDCSDKYDAISEFYDHDMSSFEKEPLEHWLCTTWLASKLEEKGETIVRDFYGLEVIWCRCCSGQAIYCDYVIQEIYNELINPRSN